MTSHYHLELEVPGGELSRPLQWLKSCLCWLRKKGIHESRDMAIYLSRKYASSTCYEIGEYFGGIRPSAVSLVSRRMQERVGTDKAFKELVSRSESDVLDFCN